MKRRLLRRLSTLFGWVIGVAGCGNIVAPEYGMPHADFDLDGKVVRSGTTIGIPGIEVRFSNTTVVTNADGEWTISADGAFACGPDCELTASDVDGETNGAYQDTSVEFTATRESDGSGSWYDGEWEAHDINISMEPTDGTGGE